MTTVTNKNGIAFDIDALATDVNGKMDRDCLNYSATGGGVMARMALPSKTYIDLTLGAGGATYTAPADGWFALQKNASGSQYMEIIRLSQDNSEINREHCTSGGWGAGLTFPVLKGDTVKVNYNLTGGTVYFRFIYAVGSESEAS